MRLVDRHRYLVASCVILGCACRSEASGSAPITAASASAGSAWTPTPSASAGHIPVLEAPPSRPPPGAQQGPGFSYRVVQPGHGPLIGKDRLQLVARVRVHTPDGGRVAVKEQVSFSDNVLPEPLRRLLDEQRTGVILDAWLSQSALTGWKPSSWPSDTDLAVRLQIVRTAPFEVSVTTLAGGEGPFDDYPYPLPDLAGPPREARVTQSGLRFVRLRGGSGAAPAADQRIEVSFSAFLLRGLVVEPHLRDRRVVLTTTRAPGALGEVISALVPGESVRIWLSRAQMSEVLPGQGQHDGVLDLTLVGPVK